MVGPCPASTRRERLRLAEADGLCLVVPAPENGWALFLTADPSRVVEGSIFHTGAVENGVDDERASAAQTTSLHSNARRLGMIPTVTLGLCANGRRARASHHGNCSLRNTREMRED